MISDFSITTNGTLITERVAEFLVENDFIVAVSLNGPKEEHNRLRIYPGGKGTFDDVMKGLKIIRNVAKRKGADNFNIILIAEIDYRTNLKLLWKFFNEIKDIARLGHISFIKSFGTDYYNQFTNEDLENFKQTWNELWDTFKEYVKKGKYKKERDIFLEMFFGRLIIEALLEPVLVKTSLPYLPFGRYCVPGTRLYVTADGKFLICERSAKMLEIGDIHKGIDFTKIRNILNNIKAFQMRYCSNCRYRYLCTACAAMVVPFDKRLCDRMKSTVLLKFRALAEIVSLGKKV